MKRSHTLSLLVTILFLAGCQPGQSISGTETPTAAPGCGNNVCESFEDSSLCPQDCPAAPMSGERIYTYIQSEGIGKIAVMVAYPKTTRYTEGAGVVVIVSPFFSAANSFMTDPDLTSIGLIQVSYLWPGKTDTSAGVGSEGEFDYGGEESIQVLRDVIRFAVGRSSNTEGRTISTMIPVTPLTTEVGLYAFSNAGLAAVNVMALYGDKIQGVEYYVARETPTLDSLTCLEAGYRNGLGQSVLNPFYVYPTSYQPESLALNYANLRWDADYIDSESGLAGRPYLDLDSNGVVDATDYMFGWRAPVMFGKHYFSTALTQALLDTGALTRTDWPTGLATPEQAAREWAFRQSVSRFIDFRLKMPDLKVMLVFAANDHVQAAEDKPHIHQAFQGFRFVAQLDWVRLNPDRAYVQQILAGAGNEYPDNPANLQPLDWTEIATYAYSGQNQSNAVVPLAAVAEMADRAHAGRWDENLGASLYVYTPPTPEP